MLLLILMVLVILRVLNASQVGSLGIKRILEGFAGAEHWYPASSNGHGLTCAWMTAEALIALAASKAAKTRQAHGFAATQGVGDLFQQGGERQICLVARQTTLLGQMIHQIRLKHKPTPNTVIYRAECSPYSSPSTSDQGAKVQAKIRQRLRSPLSRPDRQAARMQRLFCRYLSLEFALPDNRQLAKPLCHWRRLQQLGVGFRPDPKLAVWLGDEGSLTAKLIALSGGQFRVQLLSQRLAKPRLDERQLLGLGHQSLALVREVVLLGGEQPWVFARSLMPLASLTGPLRRLRKQGTRPLGAFLFAQPQLQRGPIAVCALNRHHGYLPEALLDSKPAWGRRSVFRLYQRPLLVSEVFLEPLQQLICNPVQD